MDKWFGVQVPSQQEWDCLAKKFDRCKEQRQAVARKVLGHSVLDDDWLIFDDLLEKDYVGMCKLIKLLDEKAG